MTSWSIKLPERAQAKTYLIAFVLGFMIALLIWGVSYVGWFGFKTPPNSFQVKPVNTGEAVSLETLLDEHEFIQSKEMPSESVELHVTIDYWEKVLYPKDLFVFHICITNKQTNTLWYPTILALVIDSRDYVRGKAIIQLWGEDNAIEEEQTAIYIFHLKVPEDMQGDNVFIKAFLYGEFSNKYPHHDQVSDILPTMEDEVYGRLPYDWNKNRFLSSTLAKRFKTYPHVIDYVFQAFSLVGTFVSLFLFTLSFMVVFGEKLRKFLSTDKGLLFIMIFSMILLLIVVFLVSLYFY